jgi:hypothetical protein
MIETLFLSVTLPTQSLSLMNTTRPSDFLFLRSLILTVGCFGAVASVNANPAVSNLSAAQRAGTKLVDITYDLAAKGGGKTSVVFQLDIGDLAKVLNNVALELPEESLGIFNDATRKANISILELLSETRENVAD